MYKGKQVLQSKVKCPKCNNNNLHLNEIWDNASISWIQVNGQFDKNAGSLEPGDPRKVMAYCGACDHWWTIRGATQIDDIIKNEGGEQKGGDHE